MRAQVKTRQANKVEMSVRFTVQLGGGQGMAISLMWLVSTENPSQVGGLLSGGSTEISQSGTLLAF